MLIRHSQNNTTRSAALMPQAVPQKTLHQYGRSDAQRAARNATDARQLAAVSGVVIPSKFSQGHLPDQGRWEEDEGKVYPCSVCDRKFRVKAHVKVHMWPCVKRNGNPNGVCWDDAWKNGALPAGGVGVQPK